MIESMQSKQDHEGINVQRAFWAAIIFTIVAFSSVALSIYLVITYPVWQVIAMAAIAALALVFDIIGVVLIRRNRAGSGLKILYWSGLFTVPANAILFTAITPVLIAIVLVIGFVEVFLLFPPNWRKYLQFGPVLAAAAMFLVEFINPPFRFDLGIVSTTGYFGQVVLGFVVVGVIVTLVRQAWSGNIRVKLVTSFTVIALISVAIVGTVVYFSYRNQIREDFRQRLLNIVTITAIRLDGDLHATLQTPEDMQTEAYRQLMAEGDEIIATDLDLIFSYTMRKNEQGQIYFVIDSRRADDTERDAIGTIYDEPSDTLQAFFNAPDRPIVEEEIYTDKYGSVLSAFAPFYRADGSLEGIFGIDIAADVVLERERNVLYLILITTLVTMIFVTLIGLFLGNLFARPIVSLSSVAQKITEGDLDARAKIETTDEVGDLAKAFNKMTSQLQETLHGLEIRVAERTTALEQRSLELADRTVQLELSNVRTQKRASQFQGIADVSRATASVRKLSELLPRIVKVVSEQFGFYHTGIFLVDEANQYAILSAASSEGGQRMLERGHRLRVGDQGIVGYVTNRGEPRIALDTGTDAVFFENPDLPDTRSEMAIPLKSGGKIIGALDVQSNQSNAFSQEDSEVLQILADQISAAIENARQFDQTQKSLTEAETIYRQYLRREWEKLGDSENILGYRRTVTGTEQLDQYFENQQALEAQSSGLIQTDSDLENNESTLAVPIKIRDEIIGVLNIRAPGRRAWKSSEVDMVKSVADRVAISAENARLFEETTNRAERERTVSEITSKIRSTNDPNEMIQIALNELKQTLRIKDAQVGPYLPPQSKEES